ncbi:Glyceraldehyde-3-phosphate dehydrogenase [Alphaproteobacteria bacterium]
MQNDRIRVAINGFGRIGRCILRAYIESEDILKKEVEISVINSGNMTVGEAVHLLKYDSTHGTLRYDLSESENCINLKFGPVQVLSANHIEELDWCAHDIDIVLECTGQFNTRQQAIQHIKNGAKKVIVSAPCKEADITVILGGNEDHLTAQHNIISIGSCTTNCIVPIVKILNDTIGIEHGFMTTIHAYTNDQKLLDGRHKDKRRARAACMSMIPTSTGAAKSIGEIIPELKGKIGGTAIRVPVPNVSLIDFKFSAASTTTPKQINQLIQSAISTSTSDILDIVYKELVSIDFNHTKYSAIFDTTQTYVVGEYFCRVAAWYDNEWGFSHRMLDTCRLLAKFKNKTL